MNAEMTGQGPRNLAPKPETDPAITPEEFSRRVDAFPLEAQDRIAALSSLFMEADVFDRIKGQPAELKGIVNDLSASGLSLPDVYFVFKYFDLPKPPSEKPERIVNPV